MPDDLRIFGAPARYYQGPGLLDKLGRFLAPFEGPAAVVLDAGVSGLLGDRVQRAVDAFSGGAVVLTFAGEITYAAVDALAGRLDETAPGVVIGIGGGKALDAAKALSLRYDAAVVTVPTVASNDSPTSCAIAMYDDDHIMVAVDKLPRSPALCLVDTEVILGAPAAFLRAGIGDALAKKFEAEACRDGTGQTPFGARPTSLAIAIADHCFRTLIADAEAAIESVEQRRMSAAFGRVVEASILSSGLGFENGGLSIAHSLTRGLVRARGARQALHGQQVAWGLLVQLVLEGGRDDLVDELVSFYGRIGLARNLRELGMERPEAADVEAIARYTMTAPHLANFPRPVTPDGLTRAIGLVEEKTGDLG